MFSMSRGIFQRPARQLKCRAVHRDFLLPIRKMQPDIEDFLWNVFNVARDLSTSGATVEMSRGTSGFPAANSQDAAGYRGFPVECFQCRAGSFNVRRDS